MRTCLQRHRRELATLSVGKLKCIERIRIRRCCSILHSSTRTKRGTSVPKHPRACLGHKHLPLNRNLQASPPQRIPQPTLQAECQALAYPREGQVGLKVISSIWLFIKSIGNSSKKGQRRGQRRKRETSSQAATPFRPSSAATSTTCPEPIHRQALRGTNSGVPCLQTH